MVNKSLCIVDSNKGKDGCAANALLRQILGFAAENADILVPQTWGACCEMGLDTFGLTQERHPGGVCNECWGCSR